jgi:hypothetical protein
MVGKVIDELGSYYVGVSERSACQGARVGLLGQVRPNSLTGANYVPRSRIFMCACQDANPLRSSQTISESIS